MHIVVRCWVVGEASGRINLFQLHSHIGGVLHGSVSELMASCVCRSAVLGFMDGVGEATAATPSYVYFLLLRTLCHGGVERFGQGPMVVVAPACD